MIVMATDPPDTGASAERERRAGRVAMDTSDIWCLRVTYPWGCVPALWAALRGGAR